MRSTLSILTILACTWASATGVHYVDIESTNPVSPFLSWQTAATNIQAAVDVATNGETVLVADGVYSNGTRLTPDTEEGDLLPNRLLVTNAVLVQSANGPEAALIVGEGSVQAGAVRCAYLSDGAILSGFTLTNGSTLGTAGSANTMSGGGAYAPGATMTNCIVTGCQAISEGGGIHGGMVIDTLICGNRDYNRGGGVAKAVLRHCRVAGNVTYGSWGGGGGALDCVLESCVVVANSASHRGYGGGVAGGAIRSCVISGNSAVWAGGISAEKGSANVVSNCLIEGNYAASGAGGVGGCTVFNSRIAGNTSGFKGGGAYDCSLMNCAIWGNEGGIGGGAYVGGLTNCTVVNNSATQGGGTYGSDCENTILYANFGYAGSNHFGGSFQYSRSTPRPTGPGNTDDDPLLASLTHLAQDSPCIGAGTPVSVQGQDIDGELWATPPSMGCDEYVEGAVTGLTTACITPPSRDVAARYPLRLSTTVSGRVSRVVWDFGDGGPGGTGPVVEHAWDSERTYLLTVTAFNESYPQGIAWTSAVEVVEYSNHYVSVLSTAPEAPYTNWSTAASNVQDAVDACVAGGTVFVSNGVYGAGRRVSPLGRLPSRVVAVGPITIASVNGPSVTRFVGDGLLGATSGVRCVYLAGGAQLQGLTLAEGSTFFDPFDYRYLEDAEGSGGGLLALSGAARECVISGNTGTFGAGVAFGRLDNCLIAGNSGGDGSPPSIAGGASASVLVNCTVAGNRAWGRGGVSMTLATNCVVHGNTAEEYSGNHGDCTFAYSCTTPDPGGEGNIVDDPLFVNAAAGDYHLQTGSPCIDAGMAVGGADRGLEGTPRPLDGSNDGTPGWDMGAYELVNSLADSDGDGLTDTSEMSAVGTDPTRVDTDGDRLGDGSELVADTDPLDAWSVLAFRRITRTNAGVRLAWQGGVLATQYLECRGSLTATGESWKAIFTNEPPTPVLMDVLDAGGTNGTQFYRLRVE